MANRPLTYTLTERKATVGRYAGKIIIQLTRQGASE